MGRNARDVQMGVPTAEHFEAAIAYLNQQTGSV